VAERLRLSAAAQKHQWEGAELSITISVGAADARAGMSGPAELVRWADEALYRAKNAGRNRVSSHD
jgi:diguanylate cyclase (GGDEF)-like protein